MDLISKQSAIDAMCELMHHWFGGDPKDEIREIKRELEKLPSAQPDTSRIENALHGKSAEEQYDFIWLLMQDYGMQFTDTRTAVIAWLRGERNG